MDTDNGSALQPLDWIEDKASIGLFSLLSTKSGIEVSFPFFDQDFVTLARSCRATWNSKGKSWVFKPSQLERLRPALAVISKAREDEHVRNETRLSESVKALEDSGWKYSHSEGGASVEFDKERMVFSVKFPFNELVLNRIKGIRGACWNRDDKSWDVPVAGFALIEKMRAEASEMKASFLEKSRPFLELEKREPLASDDQLEPFGLYCRFDPDSLSYEIGMSNVSGRTVFEEYLPFPDSILNGGRKHAETPFYSPVSVTTGKTWIRVPICFREEVSLIFKAAKSASAEFPRSEKFQLSLSMQSSDMLYPGPASGDLAIIGQTPYMILKAKKTPKKSLEYNVIAVELSVQSFLDRMAEWPMKSRHRCCAISGFDQAALEAYIEAVQINVEKPGKTSTSTAPSV